jgi:hypothetical protein
MAVYNGEPREAGDCKELLSYVALGFLRSCCTPMCHLSKNRLASLVHKPASARGRCYDQPGGRCELKQQAAGHGTVGVSGEGGALIEQGEAGSGLSCRPLPCPASADRTLFPHVGVGKLNSKQTGVTAPGRLAPVPSPLIQTPRAQP